MKYKKRLNEVIKKVQGQKNINRTSAVMRLSDAYEISYSLLMELGKWGRIPKRNGKLTVLHQIFKDYLDIPIPKKPGPMQVSGRR